MHLKEYIDNAKKELDAMAAKWIKENQESAEDWPMEMSQGQWEEQELAERNML